MGKFTYYGIAYSLYVAAFFVAGIDPLRYVGVATLIMIGTVIQEMGYTDGK